MQSQQDLRHKGPRGPFLDVRAVHSLLGPLPYGKIGSLPLQLLYFQLDAFLRKAAENYSPAVGTIPSRLLEHNRTRSKNNGRCDFLSIDADVVFTYDAVTKHTDMTFKAYFENPGYERPPHEQRVVLHILVKDSDGTQRSISIPLQALMQHFGNPDAGHQGYCHTIVFHDDQGSPIEEWRYIGVTSRNWLVRMEEHAEEIRSGSNKRFHAAWRTYAGSCNITLASELIVLNHTFEGIMAWEEEQVDAEMKRGHCLNMIPGGFKGLRFLHEHRIITKDRLTLAEREEAIAEYVRRIGAPSRLPNLLLAKLWLNDDFYLKVLAGRSDVLTPGQVLDIRRLHAEGKSPALISEIVGARNIAQVQRVLDNKTYKRVV